ncbi:MAG: response regulator, partial [Rhodobacteraceae bacterium]
PELLLIEAAPEDAGPAHLHAALAEGNADLPVLILNQAQRPPDLSDFTPGTRIEVARMPAPRAALLAQIARLATPRPTAATGPDAPPEPVADSVPRLMRVLAAEDNRTNRLVFSKMVKDLAIELRFAEDGVAAVEAFRQFRPDLIFMDISMPRMDGKEATAQIRALEAESGARVPIVALTAHAMTGDQDGILAAGLDVYLTKPLRKDEIIDRIAAAHPPDCAALRTQAAPDQEAAIPVASAGRRKTGLSGSDMSG